MPLNEAPSIAAIIPAHPSRLTNGMLERALESVTRQTLPVTELHLEIDHAGEGAAVTRNRALQHAETDWVAFLDSDDWWYPNHLETLYKTALETDADYVFSYFTVHDRYEAQVIEDPLQKFGVPFDPENPHQTTVTTLVRTHIARRAGFHSVPDNRMAGGMRFGEDYAFTLDCLELGAKIVHVPARTWAWRHHGANSSGLPGKGDA